MGYQSNRPTEPNLLLLSGGQVWHDSVRHELAAMDPGIRLETVDRPEEAVRQLAMAGQTFSHLLLQPGSAGGMMATLLGLTAGEDSSGVDLVVLGTDSLPDAAPAQSRVRFVPEAIAGWLTRAVTIPLDPARDETLPSLAELRESLSSTRIQARYQPIVRIADRIPVGLEVLARFDHPVHGTMRPDLFVPQIEAAGLALQLTETIINRAFDDWPGPVLSRLGLFITVNFPLDVLLLPAALEWLEQRRVAAAIPADRIVIELTESRPVEHLAELRRSVERLRALGYGLAIDDVGPAIRDHSPLLGLKFTALKLDKDLVRGVPRTASASEFLAETVAVARRFGLTVIAEGVETSEIWVGMAAQGVDQAQGFLVARPLPAPAVVPWYEDWCERFTR